MESLPVNKQKDSFLDPNSNLLFLDKFGKYIILMYRLMQIVSIIILSDLSCRRALSDTDADGKMDINEFSIACKLINLKLRGFEIPKTLPVVLIQSLKSFSTGEKIFKHVNIIILLYNARDYNRECLRR